MRTRPVIHATSVAVVALPFLAAAAFALAGRQSPPAQASSAPQRPTFRAGANFVQVDAYPTAGGRPVADLSKDEFEVLEDGVPQSVATFEHVSVRAADPTAIRVEPRSQAESNDMVADPHNRLFVLFLDSYHVTDPTAWHNGQLRLAGKTSGNRPPEKKPLGQQAIDKAVVAFLERAVGPNDLVAPMSPEMDASQLVFTRRPERFADWVEHAWARRFSWDDLDPEEERWAQCYPTDDAGDLFHCFTGILEQMVLRRREMRTLRALDDTVSRLGALREGRKAVLLISEGWPMYRPDQQLARALPRVSTRSCPPEPPPPKGIYVGPGGKLQTGTDPRDPFDSDRSSCDASRLQLALIDNQSDYRRLLDRANRDTVSFYPIDPRGLAVFDTPIDARSPGPIGERPAAFSAPADMAGLTGRLETLRNLASATDGFMSESNDFNASMKRVADDLSEYYLLGYNSTNTRLDGRFRKITVRVKRTGVQVRARRGYLAATEAEMAAGAVSAAPVEPEVRAREAALASLGTTPLDRVVRLAAGFDWVAGPEARLWTVAELGDSAARLPEWREAGDAQFSVTDADGSVVASGHGPLSSAARALTWKPDGQALPPGDYLVRLTAKPASGGAAAGEQLHVTIPPSAALAKGQAATPRLLRRGPTTGLAYLPTADTRFRRVERLRLSVSLVGDAPAVSARLLDRRGQAMAVPVSVAVRDDDGMRAAVCDATLASLAPGDYLVELTLGEGPDRRIIVTAFRIVP